MIRLNDIPKIDLHLHIDGSVLPETAQVLAAEQDMPEKELSLEEITRRMVIQPGDNGTDFKEFELPIAVMQTERALRLVTHDLTARLANEGVVYAELRFAPQFHLKKGLSQRQVIEAVLRGADQACAEYPSIDTGIILCAMHNLTPASANRNENLETVRLAHEFIENGTRVVGIDLAGYEDDLPDYADIFALAADLGVPATCHAEFKVNNALSFGTPRIGHGYQAAWDEDVARYVKEHGITLEMCPISSIISYDLARDGRHPLKVLYDRGVKVTVNTDNLTVLGTSLDREYECCLGMGFTPEDIVRMNMNSVNAAFMTAQKKQEYLSRLESCLS